MASELLLGAMVFGPNSGGNRLNHSRSIRGNEVLSIWLLIVFALGGCAWPLERRTRVTAGDRAGMATDLALRNLCDVDRIRARSDFLAGIEVDRFRQVALKISKAITSEDIDELRRLGDVGEVGKDLDSTLRKRRAELIEQIYSTATSHAGFKLGVNEKIESTELSFSVDIDPLSSGNDPYVNLVKGYLPEKTSESSRSGVGTIVNVILGAYPDQSRYHVHLLRVYRMDSRADGTPVPLYEALSLTQYIQELLPRQCVSAGSSLDLESFDTLAGLSSDHG